MEITFRKGKEMWCIDAINQAVKKKENEQTENWEISFKCNSWKIKWLLLGREIISDLQLQYSVHTSTATIHVSVADRHANTS